MYGYYLKDVDIDIYDVPAVIDVVEDATVNYNGCMDPMEDPADYVIRVSEIF